MEHRMDTDYTERSHGGLRHLLPFLIIPITFALTHAMARHTYARMGAQHREGWKNGVPPLFAELHRRAHAAEAEKPGEIQA
jgi:beta-galactosidase GanA